jgi:hypothetical protein
MIDIEVINVNSSDIEEFQKREWELADVGCSVVLSI